LLLLAALAAAVTARAQDARDERRTVCTITVNSPDEQAAFRRALSPERFRFVELIERGRPDWLASACSQGVRCDVLVISGHFDGRSEFFSDRTEASEYLPVDEMERVSCSDSCPGLFSQLKEVYLFGCNTLNPGAQAWAGGEVERSLVRAGHPAAEAQRLARALVARHNGSSRDRMRQIFEDVPVIYGFSSVAPLGPAAADILRRYFQAGGAAEVGTGRTSARLLAQFREHSMVAAAGLTATDAQAAHRRDVCQFADARIPGAQKLRFIHRLLDGDAAEARLFLDRIEAILASLPPAAERPPEVASALDAITRDRAARDRFLALARDADRRTVRARMLNVAQGLGWLSAAELRAELMRMIDELLAADSVNAADVDLVCSLAEAHALDPQPSAARLAPARMDDAGRAAILACLGSAEARARTLRALTSDDVRDAVLAQAYFYDRRIGDAADLRGLASAIAAMRDAPAQVRAIQALAREGVSDAPTLDKLIGLYEVTPSAAVQAAIAGALIRADFHAFATPELAQTLRAHRVSDDAGDDAIDILIRRLPEP